MKIAKREIHFLNHSICNVDEFSIKLVDNIKWIFSNCSSVTPIMSSLKLRQFLSFHINFLRCPDWDVRTEACGNFSSFIGKLKELKGVMKMIKEFLVAMCDLLKHKEIDFDNNYHLEVLHVFRNLAISDQNHNLIFDHAGVEIIAQHLDPRFSLEIQEESCLVLCILSSDASSSQITSITSCPGFFSNIMRLLKSSKTSWKSKTIILEIIENILEDNNLSSTDLLLLFNLDCVSCLLSFLFQDSDIETQEMCLNSILLMCHQIAIVGTNEEFDGLLWTLEENGRNIFEELLMSDCPKVTDLATDILEYINIDEELEEDEFEGIIYEG